MLSLFVSLFILHRGHRQHMHSMHRNKCVNHLLERNNDMLIDLPDWILQQQQHLCELLHELHGMFIYKSMHCLCHKLLFI